MAYSNAWVQNTPATNPSVAISPNAGDLLIAYAITDTNNAADLDGIPSGFTQHARLSSSVDNAILVVATKVATGSETSAQFTSSSGNSGIAGVLAFSGIDQTTPLDVSVVTSASPTSSSAVNDDLSITPVTNGCDIVFIEGRDDGSSDYSFTFSTISGTTGAWTNRADQNSGFLNVGAGSASQTTAGALTARCASTSGGCLGVLLALRPAATYTLEQEGFRWGVDDGNEASHSWEAVQDTNITIAANQSRLLRGLINATDDPGAIAYTLRSQKNGSGGYTAVPVGATTTNTPTPDTGDATNSGSNTAGGTWSVSVPAAATGDLLVIGIAWDDSTTTTDVTEPSGQNGETLSEVNATPATDASTETRCKVWYVKCTGTWTAGTINFTPSASESWSAVVVKIPAGEFDAATPIGASTTAGASGGAETNLTMPGFSAGASDGDGRLFAFCSADTDPQTVAADWTSISTQDLGAVTHGMFTRDAVVSDSESIASDVVATIAGDSWALVAFVVRGTTVNNECYITTSGNIAGGGEATTARLTAPSGKTTSDFVTGRRWDDENGTDTIDITDDDYTELEWLVALSSAPSASDYFDFRVYQGASALDTYTVTPRWTISGGISDTLGRATETDTAQAFGRAKAKAIGSITETNTAQALARNKTKALALASETDITQSFGRSKAKVLGSITETDTAQTLVKGGTAQAIAQVVETDIAQGLAKAKAKAIDRAVESDTAQALARAKAKSIGFPTETNSAFAFARSKIKAIGQAVEINFAQTFTGGGVGLTIRRLWRSLWSRLWKFPSKWDEDT